MENFDTDRFIMEVEKRPAIWDNTLEIYSVQTVKKQCWDEIIEIFGGKGLTATGMRDIEITLQKKWKGLRGCFTRELRRQEKVLAGDDPGPRKSQYKYFQQMLFLCKVVTSKGTSVDCADYTVCKESTSSIERIKREDSINIFDDVEEFDEGEVSELKAIEMIQPESNEEADPLREHRKVKRLKCDSSEEDEDKMFLLSLLSTLRRVPLEKKISTKIKLMTVLDEATRNLED